MAHIVLYLVNVWMRACHQTFAYMHIVHITHRITSVTFLFLLFSVSWLIFRFWIWFGAVGIPTLERQSYTVNLSVKEHQQQAAAASASASATRTVCLIMITGIIWLFALLIKWIELWICFSCPHLMKTTSTKWEKNASIVDTS